MTSDTTGYLNLRLMVVVYDAVGRALAHPPRAASHRPAELDKLARRTAVLDGWVDFPPPAGHRGYAARGDGSG